MCSRHGQFRAAVWVLFCFLVAGWGQPVWAAKLILRIKAANRQDQPQEVAVRTLLPEGVGSNDVVNLDGLDLGYDVQSGVYYVHKRISLGPKQVQDFNVEINDIWEIPEAELTALEAQAREQAGKLAMSEAAASADALRQQVDANLQRIRQTQAENAIRPGVSPVQHIGAYEANQKLLGRVRRDIGHLENLVMETGQDPGKLVGEDSRALRLRRDIELPLGEYKTATVRVTVRNTSPTETRQIDVRQPLPPEIAVDDVLDANGLLVGADPDTGVCYVHQSGIEIGPGQSVEYNVTIRDKWNVNGPRVRALSANASNVLARVARSEKFESVEKLVREAMVALDSIASERGPETLGPDYVSFYRDQARRVDELEQRINRVRAALRPIEQSKKYGFRLWAPTMRTTWLIIYVILGFLALISLLFFLRWYGRTREEQMWESQDRSRREGGDER